LIRALQDFDVGQFIFSSTLLVMKSREQARAPLTEASPTQAEWDYPRSKLETEQVLREERGEIPVVVLRLAGVYDEAGHSLPLTQQIRRIYEKQLESHVYPGDTSCGQSFLHLDDLVSCVGQVIRARGQLDRWEMFLIGEPEVLSYARLQDELGRLIHDRKWTTLRIPKPVAKAGAWAQEKLPGKNPFIKPWMIDLADQHYPVEIQRARERLDWQPKHSLRTSLKPMVDELKRDPIAWYEENGLPLPKELEEAAAGRT
jgi:nucleoside-diphosphate-sugar epimerase